MFWNPQASFPLIGQTMTPHRFYQLRTAIHFTKNNYYNTYVRFWKIRPVFEAFRPGCCCVKRLLFQFPVLELCSPKASKTARLFFMLCRI